MMRALTSLLGSILVGTLVFAAARAAEPAWPTRPVHVIVPITPGSNIDIVARAVSGQLSQQFGQPFVVENRPGASATLGPTDVVHAPSDGYTILFHSAAFTIASAVMQHLPYDLPKDFAGVTAIANTPLLLVVPPGKYKSVKDLVAAAKAAKSELNYATVGNGSASHFVTERFSMLTGFKAQQIPFRGTVEGLTDLMTGRVDFFFVPATTAQGLVQAGKLTALATTGRTRMEALPNVPTFAEAGFPNFKFDMWVGMFVAAKTPKGIVDRLYQETRKAIQTPEVRKDLATVGGQPMPSMTPAQFDEYVHQDLAQDIAVAKSAGITEK